MPREISDESRLRQKRGTIDLNHPEKYVPWIKVRDCTKGDGTRFMFSDIYYRSRMIHVMSGIERDLYYQLRSHDNVIELFEQYPLLPLSKTEELCIEYGIKHPKHPFTKKNKVMTTDFLLLIKDEEGNLRWKACAVKPSNKLNNRRIKEKLYIERMYWKALDVEWGVMTELQVNKIYVNNVILCKSGYSGIGNGSIYDILKYEIVHKKMYVDMNSPIDLDVLASKLMNGDVVYG